MARENGLSLRPESTSLLDRYIAIMERIKEANDGQYDVFSMLEKERLSKTPRLEAAGYAGPVEMADVVDHGQKLVTSRDVMAGELLLACKAVEIVYPDKIKDSPYRCWIYPRGEFDMMSAARLRRALAYKKFHNPEIIPVVEGVAPSPSIWARTRPPFGGRLTMDSVGPVERGILDAESIEAIQFNNSSHMSGLPVASVDEDPDKQCLAGTLVSQVALHLIV